ncbi:MAG: shikimate kinase [Firmicutes bacterium]|nr:shikimate kinase [Bacillota bacterium]
MNMIIANRDIILTGFMGTGKSAVGKSLADLMGRTFLDTDTEVERVARKTIAALFAEDGENHFRRLETRAIEELERYPRGELVIATGGGAILLERNRRLLQARGPVVLLRATPEEIYRRIYGAGDGPERPLLDVDDPRERIEELLSRREPLYMNLATVTILTDGKTPGESAREICAALEIDFPE